jgi:hypothetical protein
MENTLYHFNYLISLVSGVFDSLALKTDKDLNINWQKQIEITLTNKRNKGIFLKQIKDKNSTLRDHISKHANFIQLIYSLREVVIHREGLANTLFSYKGESGKWKANLIEINEEAYNYIKLCGDTKCKDDKLTKWGVYKLGENYMLEPHHFSIEAITTLVKFTDDYLNLLGSPSFVEDQIQQNTDFAIYLKTFEKYHLGF